MKIIGLWFRELFFAKLLAIVYAFWGMLVGKNSY